MMFLARAGKCGALGASGLGSAGSAALSFWPLSNEASATEPKPTAHLLKKCRRVKLRSGSWSKISFISFSRNGFVQIQQDAGDRGPRCRRRLHLGQLLVEQLLEALALGWIGLARGAEREGVIELVVWRRFLKHPRRQGLRHFIEALAVEQGQSLQGGVGPHSPRAGGGGVRRVKYNQVGIGRGSPEISVHGPPVAIGAFAGDLSLIHISEP